MASVPVSEVPEAVDNRVFYLDAARSCAAILVVISHVFAPVCANTYTYPPFTFWFFHLFNSLMRPSVSIFIMISGKLLLGSAREQPYLRFVWRRFSRLLVPFFVWSMIYVSYQPVDETTGPATIKSAVLQFLHGPTAYHLWFMYLILSLYLVTPFLRRFVRTAIPEDIIALLSLWMIFLIIRFVAPDLMGTGGTSIFLAYGGYFILGYILDRTKYFRKQTDWLVLLSLGIIVFNALARYLRMVENNGSSDEFYYAATAPLVVIYGASVFMTFRNLNYQPLLLRMPWLRKAVSGMSRESYNVYLMHPFVIWLLATGWLGVTVNEKTGGTPFIGVPVTSLVVLGGALVFSRLIKKVPYVARLFVSF